MRVYKLAKELKIPSSDLMDIIKSLKMPIKSNLSNLSDDQIKVLREKLNKDNSEKTEQKKTQTQKHFEKEIDQIYKDKDLSKKERTRKKPTIKKQEKTRSDNKKTVRTLTLKLPCTPKDLAQRLGVKVNEILNKLKSNNKKPAITDELTEEICLKCGSLYNVEFDFIQPKLEKSLEEVAFEKTQDNEEDLSPRAPVVTIMGHVDHGKTSLLDVIRKSDITKKEFGGITQHIGAYKVNLKGNSIVFLDTPGHEAFTSMRYRGASVTDIVILVVAADDGIMPQTIEAINHAKAADVPIIVAINKCDLLGIDLQKIKTALTKYGLVPEEWGGDNILVEVSAKTKKGIPDLLEMILLLADMLELQANPNKKAKGTIIEAKLDKSKGPVATVLVQEGTLNVGDPFVTGLHHGKIRAMTNDLGEKIETASPSTPVEIFGINGIPMAGDFFAVVEDDKTSKLISEIRQSRNREEDLNKNVVKFSLEEFYKKIKEGNTAELNIILKADVQGSLEALQDSLKKLSSKMVKLVISHAGVGAVVESDVLLALTTKSIIIAYNVSIVSKAKKKAEADKIEIRRYRVIYDLINDIKNSMEGLLEPLIVEEEIGRAEVRKTFSVPKIGTIAGCYITDGKILRNSVVKLTRHGKYIYSGNISSLKRFKDDVKEVATGYECGIGIENYNDLREGDIIEAFKEVEKKQVLEFDSD